MSYRPGQGQQGAKLPEGYSAPAPDSVGGLADTLAIVGGCGVRRAQELSGAYRGGDELWSRNGSQLFLEGKDQYKEFIGGRAGWGGQFARIYHLGLLLYAGAGIQHGPVIALSRQHGCYPAQDQ